MRGIERLRGLRVLLCDLFNFLLESFELVPLFANRFRILRDLFPAGLVHRLQRLERKLELHLFLVEIGNLLRVLLLQRSELPLVVRLRLDHRVSARLVHLRLYALDHRVGERLPRCAVDELEQLREPLAEHSLVGLDVFDVVDLFERRLKPSDVNSVCELFALFGNVRRVQQPQDRRRQRLQPLGRALVHVLVELAQPAHEPRAHAAHGVGRVQPRGRERELVLAAVAARGRRPQHRESGLQVARVVGAEREARVAHARVRCGVRRLAQPLGDLALLRRAVGVEPGDHVRERAVDKGAVVLGLAQSFGVHGARVRDGRANVGLCSTVRNVAVIASL